jgi:hypothetical protein
MPRKPKTSPLDAALKDPRVKKHIDRALGKDKTVVLTGQAEGIELASNTEFDIDNCRHCGKPINEEEFDFVNDRYGSVVGVVHTKSCLERYQVA